MLSLSASPALARTFHGDNFFFNPNNGAFFFNNNGFFNHHNGFFFNTPGVFNGTAQESETGNVFENFSVGQSGSNSNQCVTPQQFGNTGSSQNAQPILQFNSLADGFFGSLEPEGSNFTFAPALSAPCDQSVEQSAAASG
jgi:hypothetical protein